MEDGVKRFTENIESLPARKRNDEPVLYWEEALLAIYRGAGTQGDSLASLDAEVESVLGDEPHPGYRDRHQSSLKTAGPAT
jgi:hypothetical protein